MSWCECGSQRTIGPSWFLCVGPGVPTQAVRLHSKHFYLLSHLASPKAHVEKPEVTAASLGSLWTQSCSWGIQALCGQGQSLLIHSPLRLNSCLVLVVIL